MADYSVLIVGAGPTGMELAAELHRHGIDFLIIDKRPNHITTSNAAGIHARTLECWHKKPWLHSFMQEGLITQQVSINANNNRLAQFDFSQLSHTQYPIILSIPQNQTEAILDHHLTETGNPVQRNTTLVNLTEEPDQVIAFLQTPTGEKTITAEWLVGCDGYHSTVRDLAGIEFKGTDIEERFLLVDAVLDANYEKKAFHVYLDPRGLLAFFPMQHSTRIIAGMNPLGLDLLTRP